MNYEKYVSIPRFALPMFYDRVRCAHCQAAITESDVTVVGAAKDKHDNPCFSYQYRCPKCREMHSVIDTTHPFTRPDWWNELAAWNDAAPSVEQMKTDSRLALAMLPKIGPMELRPRPLSNVWIRGGYMGDVGPVIFYYESDGDGTIGFIRLERKGQFEFLGFSDKYCLPLLDLGRFAAVADGGRFPLDGQHWKKLSAEEIEDIICDRAFELRSDDNDPVTTPEANFCSAHGSTHVKKGRKGTRRPPRNPRPMDS